MPPDNQNSPNETLEDTTPPQTTPVAPDSSVNTKFMRNWNRKRQLSMIGILLLVLLLVIGGYMYLNRNNTTKVNNHEVSAPSESIVRLTSGGIVPATISISHGASVMWVNNDTTNHSLVFIGHEDLNSGVLKSKDSYSVTFDEAGTYNYNEPGNKVIVGTIIVK